MRKAMYAPESIAKDLRRVLLPLLCVVCLLPFRAYAGCSPWMDKAVLNEYTYGSSSTNYLEVYSDWGSFPAAWPGWKIRYHQRNTAVQEFTFNYGNTNVSACTSSNKTYLRQGYAQNTLSGNSPALIELLDANGDVVDAVAINIKANNSGQLVSNSGWRTNSDNATITSSDPSGLAGRCSTLANRLSADYSANSGLTAWATTNMISASGSNSNKAYARQTDGRVGLWGESLLGGNNTTFTNCSTNNFNLAKTVNVPNAAPGGKVKFTLTMKNTGSTSLSNITVTDTVSAAPPSTEPTYVPPALAFTASGITASTGSGTPALDSGTNTITWNIPSLASGNTATLIVEATIPSTTKSGTVYTNTASSSNFNPVQTDSASVTVVPATTESFLVIADKYSACTSDTATSTTKAPLVTITAMSGLSGTGSRVTTFTGKVFLSTSSGNGTWALGPGASGLLSGNEYIFHENDQGQVKLYLADSTAESIFVSAVHVDGSSPGSTVTAGQTPSEITYGSARLSIDNVDTITPAGVAVIAGRPHQMRATMTSCSSSAAPTGSALRAWYTPSSNHDSSAQIHLSTSSTCGSGLIQLLPAAPALENAASITFSTATSTTSTTPVFYLCTSDVGQFQVNLSTSSSRGASSYQTVRPIAVTASGIKWVEKNADGTVIKETLNPGSSAANGTVFGPAGTNLTMTFKAWKWSSAISGSINTNGSLNTAAANDCTTANSSCPSYTLLSQFSDAGLASSFAASAKVKATLNSPSAANGGKSGSLVSTSFGTSVLAVPLSAGTKEVADAYYTEVGSFKLEGADGSSGNVVENFLGETGVNVPLIVFDKDNKWTATSDIVGRFTPSYFQLTSSSILNRSGASCSPVPGWSYMEEPFELEFTLLAKNALGNTTYNYSTAAKDASGSSGKSFARLSADNWAKINLDGAPQLDSLGLAALGMNIGGDDKCLAVISGTTTTFNIKHGSPANAACSSLGTIAASGDRLYADTAPTLTWVDGEGTFKSKLKFRRPASSSVLDGPYTLNFGVLPTDSDSVTLSAAVSAKDFDADNNGANERLLLSKSTRVLYGRLRMENMYGSERLPLRIPYRTQYYQSNRGSESAAAGWRTNTDDSCTQVPVPSMRFSEETARNKITGGIVERFPATAPVANGKVQIVNGGQDTSFFMLTGATVNSGPGRIGYVGLDTLVNAGVSPCVNNNDATPSYLRFMWDPAKYSCTTGPSARAVFGNYRNPTAFTRELY